MAALWEVTFTQLSRDQDRTTQPCSSLVLVNFCLWLRCVEKEAIHWAEQLADLNWILPEHFWDAVKGKPGGGVEVGGTVGYGKEREEEIPGESSLFFN